MKGGAIHIRLESGSFFLFPFMQYAFASDTVSDSVHDTSFKLFIRPKFKLGSQHFLCGPNVIHALKLSFLQAEILPEMLG